MHKKFITLWETWWHLLLVWKHVYPSPFLNIYLVCLESFRRVPQFWCCLWLLVPMSKSNPSRPIYTSILSAGGMYTPIHYDFTFLAQFTLVIAKGTAKKLFFMWPANENNLLFLRRRARGETPVGWEDGPPPNPDVSDFVDFCRLTGLRVAILSHGQYIIMPEHTLHCVLTVGTAGRILTICSIWWLGVTGFGYARAECLENPKVGVWDVERIESLAKEGLSTTGRQALMVDVHNLLDELALLRGFSHLRRDQKFEALEERLRELESRLKKPRQDPSRWVTWCWFWQRTVDFLDQCSARWLIQLPQCLSIKGRGTWPRVRHDPFHIVIFDTEIRSRY